MLKGTGLARMHLYAFDADAGVIVMEDITGAQTVERVLFWSHPNKAARDALGRLASTVGSMHAVTTPMDSAAWNPACGPRDSGGVEQWRAVGRDSPTILPCQSHLNLVQRSIISRRSSTTPSG